MQNVFFVDQQGTLLAGPVNIDVPAVGTLVALNGQRFNASAVAFFLNASAAPRVGVMLVPIVAGQSKDAFSVMEADKAV
jgi:hypothetical protein